MLKKKQRNIVRTILRWYMRQGRSLPWRNIADPYRILISEIMLQQTQVGRVLVKYPAFITMFPTLRSLANAEQRDVVLAWSGMGYNTRAVRLHRFARAVVDRHRGRIPGSFDELIALPGVGRYTANAILSSAFGAQRPVVDVNVRRVLSRLFWRTKSTVAMQPEREIWPLAERVLPNGNAYNWNQALMDFGATVCTARNPSCRTCPVSELCSSANSMERRVNAPLKNEPSMDGIPNRLYRGRIVEQLRASREGVRLDDLARGIHHRFSSKHESWFRTLLAGLERDGLIRISGNDTPAQRVESTTGRQGSLKTGRASLA